MPPEERAQRCRDPGGGQIPCRGALHRTHGDIQIFNPPGTDDQSNGKLAMTESPGTGRGGKRSGAGRKRTDPVYEAQLMAVRLGDVRLMRLADEMRTAAEASAPAPALPAADPDAIERRRRADAARQRDRRIREAQGLRVRRLALPDDELALFLIDHELLTEVAALDHAEVDRALEGYIRNLIVTRDC
jgi:hypothetical protein